MGDAGRPRRGGTDEPRVYADSHLGGENMLVDVKASVRKGSWTHAWVTASLVLGAMALVDPAEGATVDFESLDVGTLFGSGADDEPEDIVLVSDGITMSVDELLITDELSIYGFANVGSMHGDVFPSNSLGLSNISVVFDFTNVGFAVDSVSFEYYDQGKGQRVNNFAVNDGPILTFNSLADIRLGPWSDVTVTVAGTFMSGVVTLDGPVESFRIGGQELYIDNIIAVPEPATLLLLAVGGAYFARRRKN